MSNVSLINGHIDETEMTPQEAIKRIEAHNEIHSKNERFAVHITEALKLATKALKKQIPKKPSWVDSVPHSRCPMCHNAVAVYIDSPKLPYCYWCGQALDWSKNNGDI